MSRKLIEIGSTRSLKAFFNVLKNMRDEDINFSDNDAISISMNVGHYLIDSIIEHHINCPESKASKKISEENLNMIMDGLKNLSDKIPKRSVQ